METIFDELQDFAEKDGLARNMEMFAKSQHHLELWLKGSIARNLWDRSEFYRVINRKNPIFLQAIEEIYQQ